MIPRDLSFLKWRYEEQPLWDYFIAKIIKHGKIVGFAVLREGMVKEGRLREKKIGVIADMLIDPNEIKSFFMLIRWIEDFFKKRKAVLVKCDILNGLVENRLRQSGFIPIASQSGFMLDAYDHNMSQEAASLARGRGNWFISSGDSDFDFD